jgi:hypothetical protein
MMVFFSRATRCGRMTTGKQTCHKGQMQKYPYKRCRNAVSKGVNGVQGAITMDVQPVQTERDDQCPNCAEQFEIEPYGRR